MISRNNVDDTISSMHVETAADTILKSPYGIHALIIYSDSMTLQEFWSFYIKKSIEEKDELVCLAPFYESVNCVRNTLSEGHMSINVQKYENDQKSLIIVDSLEKYLDKSSNAFDIESLLKANQELVKNATLLNKKGVSFLGDSGAFLFKNQIHSLVEYESSLPKEFDMDLKGICLYHQKDFDRLSMDQKELVTKHHKMVIKI